MTLRHRAGALIYDWPRFLRHVRGNWTRLRNRNETLAVDARGARCEWQYTSELHLANVYPLASRMLLRRALHDWPIVLRDDAPAVSATPEVTFLIGHRGTARLPNLLATLRSIAGQTNVKIECIVIEQSTAPEIRDALPPWVRYVHTPFALDYCRAKTFNDGVRLARGEVLIAHDNDMLVPSRYAAELLARTRDGNAFVDPKRFIFYLTEADTRAIFGGAPLTTNVETTIVQNLKGGSIAATVEGYRAIGGFDEGFVGWGGEDLEFWERARAHGRVYEFGYLPLMHLWHAAQPGKVQGNAAPAQQRYFEVRETATEERIARLRATNFSNEK
ncbi:MAG TPA: galactosyltransferase-related protein [Thermoanaerobaculia bacterium]|nr:galactosyltransferase-related protein [Thermoanaerobaculia bacterium]